MKMPFILELQYPDIFLVAENCKNHMCTAYYGERTGPSMI